MIEEKLGDSLRRLREHRRVSLRTLADQCGFTAGFLSQIENGQSSPSIASMEKIAAALGVTLSQFFRQAESARPTIIRANSRRRIELAWSHGNLQSLGLLCDDAHSQATLMHLEPGGQSGKTPKPAINHEWAFVHSGRVILTLEGMDEQLSLGDSATIPAGTHRRWLNDSDSSTQVLIVTTNNSGRISTNWSPNVEAPE